MDSNNIFIAEARNYLKIESCHFFIQNGARVDCLF